jgi:hypothetical protein
MAAIENTLWKIIPAGTVFFTVENKEKHIIEYYSG